MAGDCRKVSAPCFKAIQKVSAPWPFAPAPCPQYILPGAYEAKNSCFLPNLRTRVDKKRIEKKHTKPYLLQVNMPLRQSYIHQQATKDYKKKYAFIDIPRINIKILTRLRMFCYSSHKIATSNKNEIT